MMIKMELHERSHVILQIVRCSEPFKKCICQRRSRGFVAGTDPAEFSATFAFFGGSGFAEIMSEHGEGELTSMRGWGALPLR